MNSTICTTIFSNKFALIKNYQWLVKWNWATTKSTFFKSVFDLNNVHYVFLLFSFSMFSSQFIGMSLLVMLAHNITGVCRKMCCHWLGHCFWSRRRLIRSNMNARYLMWRTWKRKEIRAEKASVVPAVPAAASRPPTIGSHQLLFVMLINCFHVHHSLTISLSV